MSFFLADLLSLFRGVWVRFVGGESLHCHNGILGEGQCFWPIGVMGGISPLKKGPKDCTVMMAYSASNFQ